MDDLYREVILDRYQNPHNKGKIVDGIEVEEGNLLCGDKIKLSVKLKEGVVEDVKFEGGGCAISMSAVDLLIDAIRGKKLSEIKEMKGEEIEEMMGVELTLARKKCAYLGLEVMKKIEE